MILRLSLSVMPPHTPSRSRIANACSRHDSLTGQISQIAFASSAFSSESGKNTAGSSPLQAPRCLHEISTADIGFPPRCRGRPHACIVCVGCHRCLIELLWDPVGPGHHLERVQRFRARHLRDGTVHKVGVTHNNLTCGVIQCFRQSLPQLL